MGHKQTRLFLFVPTLKVVDKEKIKVKVWDLENDGTFVICIHKIIIMISKALYSGYVTTVK